MKGQSTICQCVPIDDDSDDGHVESKIETFSTASSSLIDYNSINYDGSKSSRSAKKRSDRKSSLSYDFRHYTNNLAASGMSGCQSTAATVDDAFRKSVDNVFESAVDLIIKNTACITVESEKESKQAVSVYQDDHTVEVDYNGDLHTIVSGSLKSGEYDEIIMVAKEIVSKQRPKRFRLMGRFRPKRDPVNDLTATTSQRAPKPVSSPLAPVAAPTRQRAVGAVSLIDERRQQKSAREDANNGAVVLRSFGDKPQHLQAQRPKQQRQARALKSKSLNQATGAINQHEKQPSSSWWGKNKKKQISKEKSLLETRRYVHEQEEAIQEGDTSVLMIRMHRTPTNCMAPQTR